MNSPSFCPGPASSSAKMALSKRHPVKRTTNKADSGARIGPASPVSMNPKKSLLKREPSPKVIIAAPVTQAAFALDQPVFSASHATDGSSSDTEDVIAAKNARKKNEAPIKAPPGALANAVGSVWKKIPAPASKSRLLAKTIGKIARPAIIATHVSTVATSTEDFGIDTSLGK